MEILNLFGTAPYRQALKVPLGNFPFTAQHDLRRATGYFSGASSLVMA